MDEVKWARYEYKEWVGYWRVDLSNPSIHALKPTTSECCFLEIRGAPPEDGHYPYVKAFEAFVDSEEEERTEDGNS